MIFLEGGEFFSLRADLAFEDLNAVGGVGQGDVGIDQLLLRLVGRLADLDLLGLQGALVRLGGGKGCLGPVEGRLSRGNLGVGLGNLTLGVEELTAQIIELRCLAADSLLAACTARAELADVAAFSLRAAEASRGRR